MASDGESTVRPNGTCKAINANDRENVVSRGREETDEECAKRRRFFEKVSGSGEGNGEGSGHRREAEKDFGNKEGAAEEDSENGSVDEQDAGDIRAMKKLIDPKLPSKSDIEAHEMTHLPFRNWCRHCVKGRGVEASHFKSVRDEGALPEIHIDFCFPGSRVGGDALTVVVARDRDSKMLLSEVVPTKGSVGKFAATRVGPFIR